MNNQQQKDVGLKSLTKDKKIWVNRRLLKLKLRMKGKIND